MRMESSYMTSMGMNISIMLMASGGVIIAERMARRTIAYLLLALRNSAVMKPIIPRIVKISGTWNEIPNIKIVIMRKPKYSLIVIMAWSCVPPKLNRNSKAAGSARKYAKAQPAINRTDPTTINESAYFLSLRYSPGAMNFQS